MLSFEHNVLFVNTLIIIWLSQGGNLSVSLAIDDGNCVVAYEKVYNMEDFGQILHTMPIGSDWVRVIIIDLLDENAPLAILTMR